MNKSTITTPLLNKILNEKVFYDSQLKEYLNIGTEYRTHGMSCVNWHKFKLGKQDYCYTNRFRNYVWEPENWRVYVSKRGISFEVLETLSANEACLAWKDYYSKII